MQIAKCILLAQLLSPSVFEPASSSRGSFAGLSERHKEVVRDDVVVEGHRRGRRRQENQEDARVCPRTILPGY